jgi:hypothetical protein
VAPGRYVVRLQVGTRTHEQPVIVREDPRVSMTVVQRAGWHAATDSIATLYRSAVALVATAGTGSDRELLATARELQDRVGSLYGTVLRGGGPPTADQRKQMAYFPTVLRTLQGRLTR